MNSNFFFKKNKIQIKKIFKDYNLKKNFVIRNIAPLDKAKINDLTFFDSLKYKSLAFNTKASACITTNKLEKFLPNSVEKIIVNNVLLELAKALNKIYVKADIDYPDLS